MVVYTYLRMHMKPHIYGPGYRGMLRQILTEEGGFSIATGVVGGTILYFICLFKFLQLKKASGDYRRFNTIYSIYRADDPVLQMYAFSPTKAAELEALKTANPK